MSTWSRREREAARALGGRRVVRHRGQSAPDVAPITLGDGTVLQVEVKHRKRLPGLLTAALSQALGYSPEAVPVAVVSQHRAAALAVLRLADFARLVGVELELPTPRRRRAPTPPKRWTQVSLFSHDGETVHVMPNTSPTAPAAPGTPAADGAERTPVEGTGKHRGGPR